MAPGGRKSFAGGTNNISKMGGQPLPFEVDADLEAQFGELDGDDSELYPITNMPLPDPPNARQRESVYWYRKITEARRAGPFYADLDTPQTGTKRSAAATFDPFEDAPTYGKSHMKKPRCLPDLSKFKFEKSLFPEELWDTIDPQGKDNGEAAPKKSLLLSGKTLTDKLARFDDDADGAADAAEDEDAHEVNEINEEDEEAPEEPQDDDFEDDEDDKDDYNAERYFDDGEDDYDDTGGDDAGAGDEW